MINILFPAGGFGSTLEFCIRHFSNEHFDDSLSIDNSLKSDGSMHAFQKEYHPVTFENYIPEKDYAIATPVYPGLNLLKAAETVLTYKQKFLSKSKTVLITLNTISEAEKCALLMINKVGPEHFLPFQYNAKFKDWGAKSVDDLKIWDKREILSYYIRSFTEEIILAPEIIPTEWLTISFNDILYHLEDTLVKIFDFLNLTSNNNNIKSFYDIWFNKQTYVLNEIDLVDNIMQHLDNGEFLEWDKLSFYSEALLQYKIIKNNKELKCYGVVDFPTNTIDLKSIIE